MRRVILLTTAATAIIATTLVLQAQSRGQASTVAVAPVAGSTPTIPAAPATVSDTETGAVDAALRAVRLTGEIARGGFITRDDLIASVSSTRFAPALQSRASGQLTELTTAVGALGVPAAEVVWEELPLTSQLIESSPTTARVAVWSVLIVGVPGHGAARQVWRTSTIDLVYEPAGWKVDAWTASPGPTPTLATSEPISDLASIVAVLAWLPTNRGVADV